MALALTDGCVDLGGCWAAPSRRISAQLFRLECVKLVYIAQNLKFCATAQSVPEVKSECGDVDNMDVNKDDQPVDDDISEETEGDDSDESDDDDMTDAEIDADDDRDWQLHGMTDCK